MSKKSTSLTCTIDRFENSKAVLRFYLSQNDQQELVVAKRSLPPGTKEGSVLYIDLCLDSQMEEKKKNIAKLMLKEILNIKK